MTLQDPEPEERIEQLVLRSLEGDRNAFDDLVRLHMNMVYAQVLSYVHHSHLAQDLAQDVFTKAFLKLPRLREPRKFRHWLTRITRNCCIDYLRKARKEGELEKSLRQIAAFEVESPDQENSGVLSESMLQSMLQAVGNLRSDYRHILILKHLQGLSYKEIGVQLNMSVSAVGEKLFRVRQMLKKKLLQKKG